MHIGRAVAASTEKPRSREPGLSLAKLRKDLASARSQQWFDQRCQLGNILNKLIDLCLPKPEFCERRSALSAHNPSLRMPGAPAVAKGGFACAHERGPRPAATERGPLRHLLNVQQELICWGRASTEFQHASSIRYLLSDSRKLLCKLGLGKRLRKPR